MAQELRSQTSVCVCVFLFACVSVYVCAWELPNAGRAVSTVRSFALPW